MAESRDELRRRLRTVAVNAMMNSDFPDGSFGEVTDAAEAVYAAALRDVLALMEPIDWQDPAIAGWPQELITRHAASLGIDLDDAP